MKKGEIYWAKRNVRDSQDPNKHMRHPIICLEDVDDNNLPDKFRAAILSGDSADGSIIHNEKLSLTYFEKNKSESEIYQVPWMDGYKHEYLVVAGFLKPIKAMKQKPSGKLNTTGIKEVEKILANANVKYDYIPYQIKAYAKRLKNNK